MEAIQPVKGAAKAEIVIVGNVTVQMHKRTGTTAVGKRGHLDTTTAEGMNALSPYSLPAGGERGFGKVVDYGKNE